ncbi:hypothetical protein LDG_5313 [Legionella drancourtii LLAP12]|uniref:Uncharacterized protein n=1 Tax=Legionella drancourtii LLAP12 TaxID=658187 RepID=G9EJF1_9GAMM|nr:hypothetical protein LDG_5313 [Legionella drancourtii LLAP12]
MWSLNQPTFLYEANKMVDRCRPFSWKGSNQYVFDYPKD